MGIRLDWEIEADQTSVRDFREDKASAKRRRAARLRFLLVLLMIAAFLGGVYGIIVWRLAQIDAAQRRALVDTVGAEVAALRVSDRSAFLSIQRSASDAWLRTQEDVFNSYQQLKVQYDIQLTGNVVSAEIDGTRGRVQVEEIINGVSYVRTWFYWRYANDVDGGGGWRHVPPDYTFWGDVVTVNADGLTVRYRDVDDAVGRALFQAAQQWRGLACGVLNCQTLPPISMEILPQEGLLTSWSDTNPWMLQVPSPYLGLARRDRPLDTALRLEIANLYSERLIAHSGGSAQPTDTLDAAFMREALQKWLVGQFAQVDMQSHLLVSYAGRYGAPALREAWGAVLAGGDVGALMPAAGVASLDQLQVDWRDYLTWRLRLEQTLHTRRDQANYTALYDTADAATANLAFSRFNAPLTPEPLEVIGVQPLVDIDGVPALLATVRIGAEGAQRDEVVRFRLLQNAWRRAN